MDILIVHRATHLDVVPEHVNAGLEGGGLDCFAMTLHGLVTNSASTAKLVPHGAGNGSNSGPVRLSSKLDQLVEALASKPIRRIEERTLTRTSTLQLNFPPLHDLGVSAIKTNFLPF